MPDSCPPGVEGGREFRTTLWSVVLAARDGCPSQAADALEHLCRNYWFPLYTFLRRSGHPPSEAQDLTQGFLASLIEQRDLAAVNPRRGKFRSFLLGTFKHYLSDERKKAHAQKRGGDQPVISIDEWTAESRYRIEPVDDRTPETHFERQWGLQVLDRVMDRLRARQVERGRTEVFVALQPCLDGSSQAPYAEIGRRLGLSEGAVKVAVHRLRQEFGELLRDEIAPTVADETEIDAEIRELIRVTS
ncbi:MAG: sigma-70 family RNA polymerase sigma factor [Verrucomicrobiae bacterium]|nr:sigma-70 family RNA polymerase sigma factor [Verrucomicrobiae bacterium]